MLCNFAHGSDDLHIDSGQPGRHNFCRSRFARPCGKVNAQADSYQPTRGRTEPGLQ